ncbi:MAG: hypothetical protein OQK75_07125, partial [Gammaproteobacteria bacterium]|nr:hypothetical protein [Gammaproteobacteria bacterium]
IAIFLLVLLNPAHSNEEGTDLAHTEIIKMLNSREYNHDKRGNMPTDYKYTFKDKCHLSIHSEWYGKTHGLIEDKLIPLKDINIFQETNNDSYFLYLKCKKNDCIKIDSDNTGEMSHTMFVQTFIYAGKTKESFIKIKQLFNRAINSCTK